MTLPLDILKRSVRKLLIKYAPPDVMVYLKHYKSQIALNYSKKHLVADKVPKKSILVLAPHPDDEIIGMGGTLSMHIENQSEVTVLYLTDGRHDCPWLEIPEAEMINIRRMEAEEIGKKYCINQIFWEKEDTCLINDSETVSAMIEILHRIRPKIIYLPALLDNHRDHYFTNLILLDALKSSSLTKMTVIGYEVWNNVQFPNYVIDISSCFKTKIEMLNHYATPLKGIDYIKSSKYRNALNYYMYVNSRIDGYAEAFYCLDSETYQELFNDSQQYISLIPSHSN